MTHLSWEGEMTFEELLEGYKTVADALLNARDELDTQEATLARMDALLWMNEAVAVQTNDRLRKAAYEGLRLEDEKYLDQLEDVRVLKREIAEYEVDERIARKRIDYAIATAKTIVIQEPGELR